MRLSIPALLVAFAATSSAAELWWIDTCCLVTTCDSNGTWQGDNGAWGNINFNEGCRDLPIPGLVEFCIDWMNRRAHFPIRRAG